MLAARAESGPTDRAPGTVSVRGDFPLRIAIGDGWLGPLQLQRAGGKPLDTGAFLRGRPIANGSRLGEPRE